MSNFKLWMCITCLMFLGCSNQSTNLSSVNVSGKIIGYQGLDVLISLPIEGSGYAGFTRKVDVQPDGNFSIDVNLNKASFVTMMMGRVFKRTIVLEPNKSYKIEIDGRSMNSKFTFLDASKNVQDLYSSFENPDYLARGMPSMNSSMTNKDYHAAFDRTLDNELVALNKFASESKISDEVLNLLKADRQCYRAARKGELAWRLTRVRSTVDAKVKAFWKEIFEQAPPINSIASSPWFLEYAKSYTRSKAVENPSFSPSNHRNVEKGSNRFKFFTDGFVQHFDKSMSESAFASYLHKESSNGKNEKACIDLFSAFKSKYRKSAFIDQIEPKIKDIEKYYRVIDADFAKGINFIDNPQSINSIAELTQRFKGQKLYVDVWASWCGPCRREFSFNETLKPMLKKHDVTPVYISTDKAKDVAKWHRYMKQYDLKGYHINASQNLKVDIQRHYGGGLRIPYYLLIDENGKVAVNHASRPSQLNKLEQEIINRM